MIVVDTNVIASFWIPGPRAQDAREARRRDAEWIAPVLWRSEFRSVLRQYLVGGLLSLGQARWYAQKGEQMMKGREYEILSADVLRLVERTLHSSYDCEYVALADVRRLRLVTGDEKVAQLFPGTAVMLEAYAAGE